MSTPADQTSALLATLWQKNKPLVEERIALLERAATHPLTAGLREEAIAAAHKLSGSLGMYGYPKASELASQIEHALKGEEQPELVWLVAALRSAAGLLNG